MADFVEKTLFDEAWRRHDETAMQFREKIEFNAAKTEITLTNGLADVRKDIQHGLDLLTRVMENKFEMMSLTLEGIQKLSNKCAADIDLLKPRLTAVEVERKATSDLSARTIGVLALIISGVGLILKWLTK